jgi:hypothetical protein
MTVTFGWLSAGGPDEAPFLILESGSDGMKKACVFVDGENFRYSLKDLFPDARYTFRKSDVLVRRRTHRLPAVQDPDRLEIEGT